MATKGGTDIHVEQSEEFKYFLKKHLIGHVKDDEKINANELGDFLRCNGIFLAERFIRDLLKLLDIDRDGCLSIDELVNHYEILMVNCIDPEELISCFKKYDTNKNGQLEHDEIVAILTSGKGEERWGIKEAKKFVKQLMDEFDKDKSGMFSYDEFVIAYMNEQFNFNEVERPVIEKEDINERFTQVKTPKTA